MIKLWRIDADYETPAGEIVGQVTCFSFDPDHINAASAPWRFDAYEVEVPRYAIANMLLGRPWPTLPLDDLIVMATQPPPAERLVPLDVPVLLTEAAQATEGVTQLVGPIAVAKKRFDEIISRSPVSNRKET